MASIQMLPFWTPPVFGQQGMSGIPEGGPPSTLLTSMQGASGDPSTGFARTTGLSRTMKGVGYATVALQGISSAIGSFYAAKSAQYQEKTQASSLAFEGDMAALNASRAEITAQSIQEAGKNQVANYTMQAGEQKAQATASMAARGIVLGVGSAANVSASMDVQKSENVLAINSNTARQAWAARQQETNYQNQSALDRVSAVNALRSAGSISPGLSVFGSLLGSAARVSSQWDMNQYLRSQMALGMSGEQAGIGAGG